MNRVAALLLALVVGSANAATFTVTNNNDSGPGSLRQAVIDANADTVSDTINFAVTGSIVLTTGQLDITTPMTITGPGAGSLTIDGNQNSRIFSIFVIGNVTCTTPGSDFQVEISGLTLTRGWRTFDNSGGAIFSEKSLALRNVTVTDSEAKAGGGLGWAIAYSGQTLVIENSTFSGNLARDFPSTTTALRGGGVYIFNRCPTPVATASISITDSDILDNHVRPTTNANGAGGGVEIQGPGSVNITRSRISGNSVDAPATPPAGANYRGGGLRYGFGGKSITIRDSEISDNSAGRSAGLTLYNNLATMQDDPNQTQAFIYNSTISGNTAVGADDPNFGGRAGGVSANGNVNLYLYNSTVSNNTAAVAAGGMFILAGATDPPGPSNSLPPVVTLNSTIVSGNSTDDLAFDTASIAAVFIGGSDNLTGTLQTGVSMVGSGNISSNAPQLGALAFNGGATRTMALLAGSPAIDTGSNPSAQTFDQRGPGFPRTVGAGTDIGAYEREAPRVVAAAAPVPTLSESVLALLALLTGIAGFAALRRRG